MTRIRKPRGEPKRLQQRRRGLPKGRTAGALARDFGLQDHLAALEDALGEISLMALGAQQWEKVGDGPDNLAVAAKLLGEAADKVAEAGWLLRREREFLRLGAVDADAASSSDDLDNAAVWLKALAEKCRKAHQPQPKGRPGLPDWLLGAFHRLATFWEGEAGRKLAANFREEDLPGAKGGSARLGPGNECVRFFAAVLEPCGATMSNLQTLFTDHRSRRGGG